MDTGKLLIRQLAYAARMARNPEQARQVEWWTDRINELREAQPEAPADEPVGVAGRQHETASSAA